MSTSKRRLPDAELDVMQAIWSCSSPVFRQEIEAHLQDSHPMALTTLLTLLTLLSEKGFIRIDKVGRRSQYTPLVCRKDYLADQGKRIWDHLCLGRISDLASTLCGIGLSREEIDELQKLLKEGDL